MVLIGLFSSRQDCFDLLDAEIFAVPLLHLAGPHFVLFVELLKFAFGRSFIVVIRFGQLDTFSSSTRQNCQSDVGLGAGLSFGSLRYS